LIPIACNSWFANKYLTQHTFSSKFIKNYIKQKVNKVIYPVNFVPKHAAIYSKQFIYSDNTKKKIEFFRTNYNTYEAQNFSE